MVIWNEACFLRGMHVVRLALAATLAVSFAAGCGSASSPEPWADHFVNSPGPPLMHMAVDGSGRVALAGSFDGTPRRSAGRRRNRSFAQSDLFVAALDRNGKHVWSGATPFENYPNAVGVGLDADGNVFLGTTFSNAIDLGTGVVTVNGGAGLLAKFDSSGKAQWTKPLTASAAAVDAIAVSEDGRVVATGSFLGTLHVGNATLRAPGAYQTFVIELDGDGNVVFATALDGSASALGTVAVDADGNVLLAGTNIGAISIGGASFTSALGSPFVAKLSSGGDPLWAFQLGGGANSSALTVDADGNVILGGTFSSPLEVAGMTITPTTGDDGFVIEVSRDGAPKWLRALGGTPVDALATDASGNVLVTGSYQGQPALSSSLPYANLPAIFVAKLDARGALVSSRLIGDVNASSAAFGIAADGSDVILAGSFSGTLAIGTPRLKAGGDDDGFVARFAF